LLKAIIDSGIDKIAAQLDSSHDGVAILGIRAHIMLTKIGSKANGGDLQPLKFAEMLLCDSSLQTRRIAGCAFRARVPWKRHEHLLFTEWHDWHVMLAAWVGVLRATAWAPSRFLQTRVLRSQS
jgi:hypothetical protein